MVGSIVPTSNWSHNCGMHVIADYMVQKIQQDNYQGVFNGKAYNELLESFKKIYKQEDLSWEKIRDASLDSSRTDSQVIWGFVLRQMLPNILKDNIALQEALEPHFLSTFHLLRENRETDAFQDHPIIFLGNKKYLQKKVNFLKNKDAAELEKQLIRMKKYWASHGFKHYCESTLKTSDEGNFIWLEEAEIVACAKYFEIDTVNLEYKPKTEQNQKKLFLVNPTQTHWARYTSSNCSDNLTQICYRSIFEEEILSQKIEKYQYNIAQVGQRYFSEDYIKAERKVLSVEDPKTGVLKQYIQNNSKQDFINYICAHEDLQTNEIKESMDFAILFCTTSELIDWLKFPDFLKITKIQYDQILQIATRYQKKHLVKTLLAEFSTEYTAENCMPALLMAAKNNDDFIARSILGSPAFNKDSLKDKMLYKMTPAFRYVLNQYDENNSPAIYYAIDNQNINLVSHLINKGACLSYIVNKQNGLMRALETNNLELIALLLTQTTSHHEWNTKNSKGENQFHIAAKQNAVNYLEKFKEQWNGLDSRNADGMNCLHIAAMFGHIEGIEFSVKNGCSLFSKDNLKNTPLHLAAKNGQLEAVKYLVKKLQELNAATIFSYNKFDLNCHNAESCSPLRLSQKSHHYDVVDFFRTIGCVDALQETFVQLNKASLESDLNFEDIILKNKEVICLVDENNNTLLHYACRFFKNKQGALIVKHLISYGANIKAKNNQGRTPLHLAAEGNNADVIPILLEKGAFIDSLDINGLTPCHVSASVDAKNAFDLLVENKATFTIEIFPFANQLYGGKKEERLNALKIAEKKNGEIAKALREKNLIEPDKIVNNKSYETQAFEWVNPYIGGIYTNTEELENTSMYARLGLLKIGYSVLYKLPDGTPYDVGVELFKQTLLYAKPSIMNASGQFYYYLKPKVHNHSWQSVSNLFDYAAFGIGTVVNAFFVGMNYYDLYTNPIRRVAGLAGGQGALKLAKRYAPESKNTQALSLFLGRELGFFMVDAYRASNPERKTHSAQAQYFMDPALNRAYETWTSVIGKSQAEFLISYAHLGRVYQTQLYSNAGDTQRWLIQSCPGYSKFCAVQDLFVSWFDNTLSIDFSGVDLIKSGVNFSIDYFNENLDKALLELKRMTHTYLVPDSEYKKLMLSYVHNEYIKLMSYKIQELGLKLKNTEQMGKENESKLLNDQINELRQQIVNSEKAAKDLYEQTSKGKLTNQFNAAQADESSAWNDKQHLETIKKMDSDELIDSGIEKLGEDLSAFALSKYLTSTLGMYNIDINLEDLVQFESKFESIQLNDPEFKQNAKSIFHDFFQSQTAKHLASKSATVDECYQKNKLALEEIAVDFIAHATPEELRMLELNKNPEMKNQKYNWVAEQKKEYIQLAALVSTRYALVMRSSTERDTANSNVIHAESNLEYSIIHTDQELSRLAKTYGLLRINYNQNQHTLTPDTETIETLKKFIKSGSEDKSKRDFGTKLLLSSLAKTGLISYDAADEKYKHKFYESLKVKGDDLETSVNAVFGEAMRETLNNTQTILVKVDQTIENLNTKVKEDKRQVMTARNVLNEKEQAYQQAKSDTLAKLTPEEKIEFNAFFRYKDEIANKFNNYSDAQSEQDIADSHCQIGIDKKTEIITLIEAKSTQIKELGNFSVTDKDMWDLVNNAYKLSSNTTDVNKYIINYFVQKGVGTFDQLSVQLWSTLCSAQKSSDDKYLIKHLYKRLCGHVEILNTQFIPNQKIELQKDIERLAVQQQKLDEDIAQLKLIQKSVSERTELTKAQYIQKLPAEQQAQFQSALDANKENQKKITNEANIKNILAIVGQGQLALETVNYQEFLSEYGQSPLKISMTLAKKLLDYKYSFLPKPNEAEFQEELKSCTSLLHVVEQAKAFESAKSTIDYEIAEFVYHQSNVSGEAIPNILNNLLKTNLLTENRNIDSISSLNLNQARPAITAIQQFIHAEVKAISIAQMGEHAIEKVWTPSVPKHHGTWHRATNNFKKMYHENKSLLVAAAALVAAIIAAKCGKLEVSFSLILKSGEQAGQAKIWGGNEDKNSQRTIWQNIQHNHHDGIQAARNELHHNLRMVEAQNQVQSENLARRTELNAHHMQNHAQHNQAPAATTEPHIPSLDNSVFQGGAFGQQQETFYPGPLRTENLPAAGGAPSKTIPQTPAESSTGSKAYLPFAYQQNAARPTPGSDAPAERASNVPAKEQGNMINNWANADKDTTPLAGSEALHSILPRYKNIFLLPAEQKSASSKSNSNSTPKKVVPRREAPKKSPTAALPPSINRNRHKSQSKENKPSKKNNVVPQPKNVPKYTSQQIKNNHSFYESFKRIAEPYLTTCGGNSDVRRNLCINNAYYQAGILNPYFFWPMAAVLGSAKVGQNIALTQQMDMLTFGLHSEIHELSMQLPIGNQAIFKDVMPLWMLYKKEGYAGIESIKDTLVREYDKSYNAILSAFRNQEILEGKVKALASSMNLSINSPEVMNKFFSSPENREMALKISMSLVYHEQTIVQKIYTNPVNSALTNPVNMAMGSFLHLDGVTVNGKRFSFSEWVKDPSNFEQRMAYFRAIFTEIVNLHANPSQTKGYHEQARKELIFNTIRTQPLYASTPQIGVSSWQKAANDYKSKATDFIHSADGNKSTQLKSK